MRFPRFRFSVRALLITVTVFGAVLGLSIRFGPHVVWKLFRSPRAVLRVVPHWDPAPIPSQPLVGRKPDEVLVSCQVGPLACEMPRAMSRSVAMHLAKGGGGYVHFVEDERSIMLFLPSAHDQFYEQQTVRFPDKAKLTFPRLEEEILSWDPNDFSWSMSHQELEWHQWLLQARTHKGILIEAVEYLWRPDVEGILLTYPSGHGFLWATTDCVWEGSIVFKGTTQDDLDWIRHLCATFAINGDPEIFHGRDEAEIKALISLTELDQE